MPLLSIACASLFLAAAVAPSAAAPLGSERWEKRVVLVFAQPGERELERQMEALLADRDGLAERDMLVLAVVGNEVSSRFGRLAATLRAGELRKAYGIEEAAPFTMILVGKDGGEKLRRSTPVAAKDVFGLIDSMPMRQSEAGG